MSETPIAYPSGQTPPPPPPYFAPPPPAPKSGVPKGVLIGCLSAAVIAVLLFVGAICFFVWIIMAATAKPVEAADSFFRTASTQGAAAAYASTSTRFQSVTTEFAFENVALQARLGQVDHASWNNRNLNNGLASLGGHLHYRGGGDAPVAVKLSKDVAGVWRVDWLDVGPNAESSLTTSSTVSPVTPVAPLAPASPGSVTTATGPTYLTYDSTGRPLAPPSTTPPPGIVPPVARTPEGLPLGQAGPPGSYLASGQVAPGCLSPVLQQGFRAEEITCPLRLPAIPGQRETCVAHGPGGAQQRAVVVTFLNWNYLAHAGSVDCRLD